MSSVSCNIMMQPVCWADLETLTQPVPCHMFSRTTRSPDVYLTSLKPHLLDRLGELLNSPTRALLLLLNTKLPLISRLERIAKSANMFMKKDVNFLLLPLLAAPGFGFSHGTPCLNFHLIGFLT